MSSRLGRAVVTASALLLVACAGPKESIVLLPSPTGQHTAVSVTRGSDQLLLDEPYAAARVGRNGPEAFRSSAEDVETHYGTALAAQPLPPAQFTLYFIENKDELTDESKQIADGVFAEIAKRPVADVMIIGHTDTVGSDAANDVLSRQRAEVVRNAFVARGLATDKVVTVGRGKRELAVSTDDGVAEPRNRRVEILVR
ncbi:MAG TPA: OmpA family protein [Caldimonas sp.]|jgi:outer membrane protein OmpA-like peptidoglycan-associated protein|nr:OmpA family protein [Caldimonas sp.]HEX4234459.1 OmpA family protein [Caldimonas sp.]